MNIMPRSVRKTLRRAIWYGQARIFAVEATIRRRSLPDVLQLELGVERFGHNSASYAVCPDLIDRDSVVYSLGVGNDISFDVQLIERFGLEVHAFDPTEESARFVDTQRVPRGFHLHQVAVGPADGSVAFTELKPASDQYVAGTITHGAVTGDRQRTVRSSRLSTIMAELGHEQLSLLKLDIEGGEFAVLAEVLEQRIPVNQIVMEFHPHIENLAHHGHMLGRHGWIRTAEVIEGLRQLGYVLIDVSERGTEFSFALPLSD